VGPELALVVVAVVVLAAAEVVDPAALHVAAAAVLFAFGIFRFVRPRAHPRWTTMRVNGRELTLWSFLMSSAHGAGLIVAPVLIGIGSASASTDAEEHVHASADVASLAADGVGLALHVGAMVLVMGVVAVLVYDRLGVAVLRKAWLNTDQLWAAAFIVAAAIRPTLPSPAAPNIFPIALIGAASLSRLVSITLLGESSAHVMPDWRSASIDARCSLSSESPWCLTAPSSLRTKSTSASLAAAI